MQKIFTAKTFLLFAVFALCCIRADAQGVPGLENINSQAELDQAITTLDAALFDAYNRCDLEKFSSFFVDDVELPEIPISACRSDATDSLMPGCNIHPIECSSFVVYKHVCYVVLGVPGQFST